MSFKKGDHVRWLCPYGYYVYGEIILIREDNHSKVIFDNNGDWNYDYYRNEELELAKPEDIRDDAL